jgi:hypothetical protein
MSNVEVFNEVYEVVVDPITNVIEVIDATTQIEVFSTGAQGAAGSSLISGVINPPTNDLGIVGDYYFFTQEPYYIYGPKTESGWPATPFFQATGITRRNVYIQGAASSTWTITHDLGGYPSVTVVNSTGTVVVGTVTYLSTSEIQIEFTAPFSGTAYLT